MFIKLGEMIAIDIVHNVGKVILLHYSDDTTAHTFNIIGLRQCHGLNMFIEFLSLSAQIELPQSLKHTSRTFRIVKQ